MTFRSQKHKYGSLCSYIPWLMITLHFKSKLYEFKQIDLKFFINVIRTQGNVTKGKNL